MKKNTKTTIFVFFIILAIITAIYLFNTDGTFSTIDSDCSYEPLVMNGQPVKDFDAVREIYDIDYSDEDMSELLFLQERLNGVYVKSCLIAGDVQ